MRLVTGAILVLVATLTACGSAAAPGTGPITHPNALRAAAPLPTPPAGTRAEAAALARQLLARLILLPGAIRLPQIPLPSSLTAAAYGYAGGSASLDQYQLFALAQPMDTAAAFLAAHVPPGLGDGGTGSGSSTDGGTMQDVAYLARSVPAGIAGAQLVLTITPARSGGSLLRADAQVIWYPPRTAAEYIDPVRYHALIIDVTIYGGRKLRTVHAVVTSRAVIARIAEALDRSQAEPTAAIVCPSDAATYQLAFSVSKQGRPVVTVWSAQSGCGGSGITVNGHAQPSLADYGTVATLVDRALGLTKLL